MIVELTPKTFFKHIKTEGPLHVVMHYGVTCGPCKMTMPHYETVDAHFIEHNVTNVKFYRFHQWEEDYKSFIEENDLSVKGVPTFKYFYMGDKLHEVTASYPDPNLIKQEIIEVIKGIEQTIGVFSLH